VIPVQVIYRKYDGGLHWHMELGRLGEDEHGTWLAAPAGGTAQRGEEPPVTFEQAYVTLIPSGEHWWTLNCNAAPCWTELYIDVTTPPRWIAPDTVEMADLDLDVIRRFDGTAEILDADEFAVNQVSYRYPPDVIAAAERSATDLLHAVQSYAEPFAEVCRGWLARLSHGGGNQA
jgi:uncharacterized protein